MLVSCFFKQNTAYEMRISDWSSDVCSSDLCRRNNRPFFPLVCWSPRPYFACQRPGSRYRRETWPTMIMTPAAAPIGAALLAATACPIRPLAAYMAAAEATGRDVVVNPRWTIMVMMRTVVVLIAPGMWCGVGSAVRKLGDAGDMEGGGT